LTDLITPPGTDNKLLLHCLATAEQASSHPLAQAALSAARAEGATAAETTDFYEAEGYGVTCTCAGQRLAAGNRPLMEQEGSTSHPLTTQHNVWPILENH